MQINKISFFNKTKKFLVFWGLWKFTLIDYLIDKWFCDCLKSFHKWVNVTALNLWSKAHLAEIHENYTSLFDWKDLTYIMKCPKINCPDIWEIHKKASG